MTVARSVRNTASILAVLGSDQKPEAHLAAAERLPRARFSRPFRRVCVPLAAQSRDQFQISLARHMTGKLFDATRHSNSSLAVCSDADIWDT